MYNFNIKMNTTPTALHQPQTHQKKKKLALSYQVVAPLAFWYIFFQGCF